MHRYGYDLDKDIVELYGDNTEKNKLREKLFMDICDIATRVGRARNILQNPVPITPESLEEWVKLNEESVVDLVRVLKETEDFIRENHVKEEIDERV